MTYIKPLSREEQAHCRRTAALSELLAKLAGLPDSEVRTVTQSALTAGQAGRLTGLRGENSYPVRPCPRHRQDGHPARHPWQDRTAD